MTSFPNINRPYSVEKSICAWLEITRFQVHLWGHKGQLDAMIKKFYHGIQKAVHLFRLKNFEHLLLGSGWNHNLRPSCRRHLARTFHTPAWCTCTFPEFAVPLTAKVGIKFLCSHSRRFGSYFDVIFLMYLVSSGFSFKPTSSSSIILIDPV